MAIDIAVFLDVAPLVIAILAVILSVWGMRKKATKDRVDAMDNRLDRYYHDLAKCEETVSALKAENKTLRKDKMDLLEKVAELASGDKE